MVGNSEGANQARCLVYPLEWTWLGHIQNLITCRLLVTRCDDEDFSIAPYFTPFHGYLNQNWNSTSFAFNIERDPALKYLPNNILQFFPDVVVVQVLRCSVVSIKGNHFKGLSKLRLLNLAHNKIENVTSDAFVDLVSLDYLDISFNRIHFLNEHTFDSLTTLKDIELDDNEFQYLHPKLFSSLVNLENIDLDNNKISSLDETIFESLTSLKNISMAGNKWERFPKNLFRNNLNLTQILLFDNKIKFIDGSVFDHLSSLEVVDLSNNLCLNKMYDANSFDAMKKEMTANCTENEK